MESRLLSLPRKLARFLGVRKVLNFLRGDGAASMGADDARNRSYWTDYNVTNHRRFASAEESLNYFHWRNAQYHNYIEMMPVDGHNGKAVLDYGCGPGNDLVGFAEYSKPSGLFGMDISSSSIAEAKARLSLHAQPVEFMPIV